MNFTKYNNLYKKNEEIILIQSWIQKYELVNKNV
jgi:hypothetical protein